MSIAVDKLTLIVEAALMAADTPLTIKQLQKLFDAEEKPSADEFKMVLERLQQDCEQRGYELKQVASGWRYQVRQEFANWVARLWEEKPQRYTRALLETLALVAYRQPITRGEIEDVRGVAVSSNIIRTLLEREWVRVVGHKDVPGRPAMYATTREFLDYFNLKSLEDLPSLAEIKSFDQIAQEAEAVLTDVLKKSGLSVEELQAHQREQQASSETPEDAVENEMSASEVSGGGAEQTPADINRSPSTSEELLGETEQALSISVQEEY